MEKSILRRKYLTGNVSIEDFYYFVLSLLKHLVNESER